MIRIAHRTLAAASCALAATLVHAASPALVEHAGVNAERGDPARWTVPADTPQRKYETQAKEAHAARAEALKECRAAQSDRAGCVAQADALHRRDMADARDLLRESRGGARRSR
jgi:hypothetical protein